MYHHITLLIHYYTLVKNVPSCHITHTLLYTGEECTTCHITHTLLYTGEECTTCHITHTLLCTGEECTIMSHYSYITIHW